VPRAEAAAAGSFWERGETVKSNIFRSGRRRFILKKRKRLTWIGDFFSWNPLKANSLPSYVKHEEPFNKRDQGRQRRDERRFKLQQRDTLLKEI